jgi:hypothetical protein
VLARLLGAVSAHGEEQVGRALAAAINERRVDLLDLASSDCATARLNAVPPPLASYIVESASASDYNHLLAAGDANE